MLYEEWEFISDMFDDFVSRIDVVIRRVPGTQCEYIFEAPVLLCGPFIFPFPAGNPYA
jgi:hypothetical protein